MNQGRVERKNDFEKAINAMDVGDAEDLSENEVVEIIFNLMMIRQKSDNLTSLGPKGDG